MTKLPIVTLMALIAPISAQNGWVILFNGRDLTGWEVNENFRTFSVKDGMIVAHGERSHCFYTGDYMQHTFRNYEVMVDVMTEPKANGGIYVDTQFQNKGWPGQGFEVQVNNTYPGDPRKTASLYEVQDVKDQLAKDNEWFTEDITVKDDTITVKLNGKEVVHWTQPANWAGTKDFPGRRIAPGTIALQGHDPGSTVYYKNIRIRMLE